MRRRLPLLGQGRGLPDRRGFRLAQAKHSFALHEELAKQFGAERIGYRRVRCVGQGPGGASSPEWLRQGFRNDMGDQRGLAQVSPRKLLDALTEAVTKAGCEIIIGKVVGVDLKDDAVAAVKLEQQGEVRELPCAALILAMGAWAQDAAAWFPGSVMPIDTVSDRYTSVIWDDVEIGKAATMVFVSESHHVEIYPRADECYANGCPTRTRLPDNPLEIVPPPETIENVKAETTAAVARLKDAKVLRTTACFLAGSDDGKPVIGMVPKVKNAVIGCGGGCWGILNGPAMGQAAAALALGEEPAVRLQPFDPLRFDSSALVAAFPGLPPNVPPKLLALLQQNPELAEMVIQQMRQQQDDP